MVIDCSDPVAAVQYWYERCNCRCNFCMRLGRELDRWKQTGGHVGDLELVGAPDTLEGLSAKCNELIGELKKTAREQRRAEASHACAVMAVAQALADTSQRAEVALATSARFRRALEIIATRTYSLDGRHQRFCDRVIEGADPDLAWKQTR